MRCIESLSLDGWRMNVEKLKNQSVKIDLVQHLSTSYEAISRAFHYINVDTTMFRGLFRILTLMRSCTRSNFAVWVSYNIKAREISMRNWNPLSFPLSFSPIINDRQFVSSFSWISLIDHHHLIKQANYIDIISITNDIIYWKIPCKISVKTRVIQSFYCVKL